MIVLFIAFLAFTASLCSADILTLKDGTVYEGVITKENRAEVVIEITIANIKTTKTFPRYKVKSIERKAVESSTDKDESSKKETTPEQKTENAPKRNTTRKESAGSSTPRDNYIVIPVNGTIGEDTNAYGLKKTLELAVRKNIKHIVFSIDSPGGYVYDAVETLKVLKEYDEALNYHALVEGGAISAASVYVAAADDIFVRPDARVGGAVAYTTDNSSGAAEVDAKLNSIWSSEIAARAESKGFPAEIFRAMVELDAEVWMDQDGHVYSSRPSASKSAQQIDSKKTILTIRAAQMVQTGMAKEFTGAVDQLGEMLDVNDWNEIKGIGSRTMIKSAKERAALVEKMEFAQKIYNEKLEEYAKHHPSTFSDYRMYVKINQNRYNYNNYNNRNNEREVSDAQDAESVNRWRERTRETINDVDIMLEAITQMASVNKTAERIDALHLQMSKETGEDLFKSLNAVRDWLYSNMNKIPFNSDGTLQPGPQL